MSKKKKSGAKGRPSKLKNSEKKISRKKLLIIFISAFLGIAVILGAVLGIMAYIRQANAAISYEGQVMDKEVASFFIGRLKTKYIHDLKSEYPEAYDSPYFWNKQYDEEHTHGEIMQQFAEYEIRRILINNYIFDSVSTLSDEDERIIETAINETLEYHTGGSEEEFDRMAAEYGFDYDSYCTAVEMLYKSNIAFDSIYGENGALVSSLSDFAGMREEYLSEYSHVKLIFIRTERKKTVNEDNTETVTDLTEEEKAQRLATISEIRAAIDAIETGADKQMTPLAFQNYLEKHGEGDPLYTASGFYFHSDSAFTEEFGIQFPEVVEKSLSMKEGSYAEVKVDFAGKEDGVPVTDPSPGVCFIYKYAPTPSAYTNSDLAGCFADFYYNAAKADYLRNLESRMSDIEIGPKFSELDFKAISTNSVLYPTFSKEEK